MYFEKTYLYKLCNIYKAILYTFYHHIFVSSFKTNANARMKCNAMRVNENCYTTLLRFSKIGPKNSKIIGVNSVEIE